MRHSRRQMPPFTRPWQASRASATTLLIGFVAAIAVAQWVFTSLDGGVLMDYGTLAQTLGLSAAGLQDGAYWQFFSHVLVHAGPFPLHLAGNLLVLYFAGREVEPIIGIRHFLGLFFTASILGGLAHVLAGHQGWSPVDAPLLGISAAVVACLVAFATILPELEVTLMLFFVLPLRVRAKVLGVLAVAVAGLMLVTRTAPMLGPSAMLTGALTGWLYVKCLGFGSPMAVQRFLFEKRQREARLERMPVEQFIGEEIDPILEKISREGMQSLTRGERRILERGRTKIASRV